MTMTRFTIAKQLEPGLRLVFDTHYKSYPEEWSAIFKKETSKRAFEEELLAPGFGVAAEKAEGAPVSYATTSEGWVARYNHTTSALAFAITEEAMEDNLYESYAKRGVMWLARAMAHHKEIKGAAILNNAFNSSYKGGDAVELCGTHTLASGSTLANELSTAADLSETSLEQMLINIQKLTDDRGLPIMVMARKLIIPAELTFDAERLLKTPNRVSTADNDVNAIYSTNMFPEGYSVNHRLTDTDAFFIMTDVDNGLKYMERVKMKQSMEGDFETDTVRYKVRERYSFGWTDWRGVYGSPGA